MPEASATIMLPIGTVRRQEEQQGQEARAAARNVVLQLEDACDQAAGRCADGSAHQHTGTHDQGTVESRLGNAAQCGNTEGSDHALAALILEVHGNSQCAAADCQVGDKPIGVTTRS